MAAIVTTEYIAQLIKDTKRTFNSGLYIGLGRSTAWGTTGDTPETPTTDFEYARESRGKTQHIKVVTGISAAVPRQDWTYGTYYKPYDDSTQTDIPYVMNSKYEVFLCIEKATDDFGEDMVSIIEPDTDLITLDPNIPTNNDPSFVALSNEFTTADNTEATTPQYNGKGFTWRYLFTLSQVAVNRFLTLNYIPISTLTSDPLDGDVGTEQYKIQLMPQVEELSGEFLGKGHVLSILVEDGGAGYSNPTATIIGDGSGATVRRVNVVDTVIRSIEIQTHGNGYNVASVRIDDVVTPTEEAILRPILGPTNGIEADPIKTLKAKSLVVTTDFENDEFNTLLTENDFRQILLFKDPLKYDNSAAFTGNTGKANRGLITTGGGGIMGEDHEITGGTSQTRAIIDYYDDPYLYYHQTKDTGFGQFLRGETIVDQTTLGSVILTGVNDGITLANQVDPAINVYSGEILYINNIAPIERDPNQTEDIKIIITF